MKTVSYRGKFNIRDSKIVQKSAVLFKSLESITLTALIWSGILFSIGCTNNTADPLQEIAAFQKGLNLQFADPEDSPLTEEDRLQFEALEFFPVDTSFRVVAKLELTPQSKSFPMKTTTERLPVYKRFAIAHFTLRGKDCSVELYQNQELILDPEHMDYLFLPFTDNTNGDSSYGGGRFIDLSIPDGNEIIIDFNQSYNPYCAYNSKYSCPIPPQANDLDLDINAGIRAYGEHH